MIKTTLNTEVLETTKNALELRASKLKMSVGDILDRVVLNWKAQDPVYAAQLVLEDLMIHFEDLKDYQIEETLSIILTVLRKCTKSGDLSPKAIKTAVEEHFATKVDPWEKN